MSKQIHEHLATDEPRIQMWGGATRGEWACGCGKTMTWLDRQDVGPLQWHMLECTMAEERSTRKAWRAAIKRAVSAFASDLPIVESATAFWTDKTDGTIHTASGRAAQPRVALAARGVAAFMQRRIARKWYYKADCSKQFGRFMRHAAHVACAFYAGWRMPPIGGVTYQQATTKMRHATCAFYDRWLMPPTGGVTCQRAKK